MAFFATIADGEQEPTADHLTGVGTDVGDRCPGVGGSVSVMPSHNNHRAHFRMRHNLVLSTLPNRHG